MSSPQATTPKIRFRDPQIEMAHGAGGKASRRLIEGLIAPLLLGPSPGPLGDAAHVTVNGAPVAITTDGFVVKPLRFPGGSIGELAVNGTVNDLAVGGAHAETLMVTFVLEAGLGADVLEAEVRAMADAARRAGVRIAGGDTKVVEHGKADGMYISSCVIGRPIPGVRVDAKSVRPGDQIILSGPIGDHGITILLARGELDIEGDLQSDTRSVLPLVEALAAAAGPGLRWMRDPTRGGVATSLRRLRTAGPRSAAHRQRRPVPGGDFAGVRRGRAGHVARHAGRLGRGNHWRRARATCRHGAGRDSLRRHARGGYAGGRSAAAHLLE
jgi:hydrogenase expression/formation protein HypE